MGQGVAAGLPPWVAVAAACRPCLGIVRLEGTPVDDTEALRCERHWRRAKPDLSRLRFERCIHHAVIEVPVRGPIESDGHGVPIANGYEL